MYEVLLTLHILAVVLWVGGGATLHVVGRRALASREPARMLAFVRDAGWIGPRLYAPLSLLLLVAGTLLVDEVGADFSDPWISIGYAGWVLAFLIGIGYYGRAVERIERAASEGGDADPRVAAGLRQMLGVNQVELAILLLVILAMTTKPG